MSLLPLSQPLAQKIIPMSCGLYRRVLKKVIFWSALLTGVCHFLRFSTHLLPTNWQPYQLNMSALLGLLCIPLLSMVILITDREAKGNSNPTEPALFVVGERFLSMVGVLFSIFFVPMLVLLLGIVGYFALLKWYPVLLLLNIWKVLVGVGVFACSILYLFAPVQVLCERKTVTIAIEESFSLIKGFYWRTFLYSFYSLLTLTFLAQLPLLLPLYIPHFASTHSVTLLFSEILIVLMNPWIVALVLVQKYDLQARKQQN